MPLYGAGKAPAVLDDNGLTVVGLTDDSGGAVSETLAVQTNTDALTHAVGTADDTIADVTGSFSQSILNNNFKEVSDQLATQRTLNTVLANSVASLTDKLTDLIVHLNAGRV